MPSKPKKSKRFRYNLETVLKVRAIREKQEQEKYHKALQRVEDEKKKETQLKLKEIEEYKELKEVMMGEIKSLQVIISRKVRLEKLKENIIEQAKKVVEAEEHAELQRQALVEAMKQKKIMIKDREKKQDAWKKFMDKEDNKFLDDIAMIGFELKKRKNTQDS